MYPRSMMITGVILVLVAIGILAFGLFMIGDEEDSMKKAARFDGKAAGTAVKGDLVLVEGKVSVKNKILVHDFVDAAKEWYDYDADWSILEAYRQPVIADLARGEILLTSENICSEAKGNNVLLTDEKSPWNRQVRYIGLKRGDPITAVGTLISSAPAALSVTYWYSGSVADHKDSLTSSRKGVYVFCLLIAVMGAGLFYWGWKKRQVAPVNS